MSKPPRNLAHKFVEDFAKRPCEWAMPMFNPCGAFRLMSGGKIGGAPGCWSCRARWIVGQMADNLLTALFPKPKRRKP